MRGLGTLNFRTHASYPVDGGFAVVEVWDSADDQRAFFDSAVRPNIPDGVPLEIQVIELRNTVGL